MHHSRARGFGAVRPLNMERMPITPEQAEAVDEVALGVFADMANAGATFAESLRAIYMTGVQHALEITEQQRKEAQCTATA